ncbi:MFS transporter [Arcanobacterium phocisimile]|uniref:MFS transporter n=1 Tax=Arcanobacterium phocisimile TaxID=1302235 RepID=A0ABX7IH36_9ACTO|nr:MFS transporter [Arcanobacterium phocisimile]QRV02434.1 MFS transporter [Arcanobacterium phocisimile]
MSSLSSVPKQPPTPHKWMFLAVLSLGLFLVGVDNSVLYTALPALRTALNTTELQGLWIINAYPLVLAGLLLGTGTLGDKIGHRRMWMIGLVIFGIASLAAAFSPNPWALIAARALLGFAAATLMPATLALLRTTFTDPRELATAIGIWAATASVGAAAGPVVGGFLLGHFWWGSIFLINIPVVIIAFLTTLAIAPANIASPEKHWDLLSSLYAMFAMFGMVMFIKEIAGQQHMWIVIASLISAIAGAVAFKLRQDKLVAPLIEFSIFYSRMFSAGALAAGMSLFIIGGSELMTTQRFQMSAGYTPLQAGLLVAVAAVAAFFTSALGGAILHIAGFRTLISGGFTIAGIGLTIVYFGVLQTLLWLTITGLALMGAGIGLVMSVSSTAIIGSAPKSRAGMAAAVEEVSYEIGTVFSVAIVGSLLPFFYRKNVPTAIQSSIVDGLAHPTLADSARAGYDAAYLNMLLLMLIFTAIAVVVTAYALRGNPKETPYAHE